MINDIVLAISRNVGNKLFVELAKKNKIKFVLGDEVDVLGRLIQAAKHVKANIVLRTTSENPYIYWEGIDALIKKHIEGNFDLSFHGGLPLGSGLEVINLKSLETSHKYGNKKHRGELSTLYIYENPQKFKIHRFEPAKTLQRPEIRLTVDTPQDLWVARIVYETLGKNGKPISLNKIIRFLDSHPRVKEINSNILLKYKRYM